MPHVCGVTDDSMSDQICGDHASTAHVVEVYPGKPGIKGYLHGEDPIRAALLLCARHSAALVNPMVGTQPGDQAGHDVTPTPP